MRFPPLCLALAGLPRPSEPRCPWADARGSFDWASSNGFAGLQLDITQPGLRPRELDASARKDIASSLARRGLVLAGLDLLIPPGDWLDASRVDRAASAVGAALELASDLRSAHVAPPLAGVSLTLPPTLEASLLSELSRLAQHWGTSLIDHAWLAASANLGIIVQGIDPSVLALSPAKLPLNEQLASVASLRVGAARLSELSPQGAIDPLSDPATRLDTLAYAAALASSGYAGALTWDGKGLRDSITLAAKAPARYAKALGVPALGGRA